MIFKITAAEKSSLLLKRKEDALNFLSGFILSGGKYKVSDLSSGSLKWLKQSVKGTYILYRGIYLIRKRVPKKLWSIVNSLSVGDNYPKELQGHFIKPHTKKLSVAKGYAKEGHVTFILKSKVTSDKIVCDLYGLVPFLGDQDILDENDIAYFKKDKEVLVDQPVSSEIIFKKGSL